ncbi:MAG TPA: sigma-70 family RNA polymerase sigma factor [Candidatus Binatia bacterium]|nr:sigma-70 family RNA polymerase sigma factor [Candidatus Binatia bacterium]
MRAAQAIPAAVQSAVAEILPELYARSGCEKIGLTRESFTLALCEVASKYLPAEGTHADARTLLLSLRVDELALAHACAAGHDAAWETFLTRYREKLYQAALRIAREDSAARELADGLYADLYGTNIRDGQRISKLSSFTGRGSLEGWLRTVLAQEFVNRYRKTKRNVSLDEENEDGLQLAAPEPEPQLSADPRLESATDAALTSLPSEDRMVLAAYYLDGRTLAEIARMLGVHESTISRKVDKLAKTLRKKILAGMVRQGMSRRQAEEALEIDVRDLTVNIRHSLAQESAREAFIKKEDDVPVRQGIVRKG